MDHNDEKKEKPSDMCIAQSLAALGEDEGEALKGYFEHLDKFGEYMDAADVRRLEKITGEEARHYKELAVMFQKYSGIKAIE
jgi:rubrerythrin